MDEFKISKSRNEKNLNKDIEEFRIKNPNYEVLNISASGFGSKSYFTIRFWVMWKLKTK